MQSQQTPERDELVEYRLSKLEQQYAEVKSDIKEMMDVLTRLDKRFASIPEGGLNWHIITDMKRQIDNHQIIIEDWHLIKDIKKQVDNQQNIIEEFQTLKWKAVGIIGVVMLVMQVFGATLIEKVFRKDSGQSQPVKIELIVPSNLSSMTNINYEVKGDNKSQPIVN